MASIAEIPNTTQINNATYIANFFTNMGWTRNAICGLLGNMWQESKLYPNTKESGGTGVGLVQWSEYQGQHVYLNWCNENGYTWSDMDVQLLRLKLEYEWILDGQDAKANWCWIENINMSYEEWAHSTQSANYLAEVFCTNYERPGDPRLDIRKEYAIWFYDNLSFEQKEYHPRLAENDDYWGPIRGSKYYYSDNIFYQIGFGLPNCTCYAWGRRYELTGKKPNTSTNDAFTWWGYNKANNIYPYSEDIPKLGAIACWYNNNHPEDGGHVAIVEEIDSNTGDITTSNSAYGGTFFYKSDPPIKASNGYDTSGYTFQGFIYLEDDYSPPTPTLAPSISDVESSSSTQITINGLSNGTGQVTLYIKWDSNTVSQSNYDITVTTSNSNFSIQVSKPRRASSVAILPVRGSSIGQPFVKENLPVSIPCINVYNNNKFVQSIPYVYTNGQWREAVPYVYTNGQWREIYNDKV